jgi:hypothetical protein
VCNRLGLSTIHGESDDEAEFLLGCDSLHGLGRSGSARQNTRGSSLWTTYTPRSRLG